MAPALRLRLRLAGLLGCLAGDLFVWGFKERLKAGLGAADSFSGSFLAAAASLVLFVAVFSVFFDSDGDEPLVE